MRCAHPPRSAARTGGMRRLTLLCTLAAATAAASAHDTWFAPRASDDPAEVALTLGTGNQFPVHKSGVGFEYLARSGCRSGAGAGPVALQRVSDAATAL